MSEAALRVSAQKSPLARVAVIDDDELIRRLLRRSLGMLGYGVQVFESAEAALVDFRARPNLADEVDVVLTDLRLAGMSGLELLEVLHLSWPEVPVCVISGGNEVATVVEAMRQGAYDYLVKPFDVDAHVLRTLERAVELKRLRVRNRFLEQRLEASSRFRGFVGSSGAMREVVSMIASVATSDVSVLILGESGTGKELAARSLHEQSRRAEASFVDINCGALTESVLESELFGHVKGAFTGALTSRRGLFEEASGGTLFLDEVGELPLSMQVKLLRVLQEGVLRPVGANVSRSVDVRIVAATNRDLEAEVAAGRFREDLFYRLNVMSVRLPPLRERRDDLPELAAHLLSRKAAASGKTILGFSPEALACLTAYSWPGNVRELVNLVERVVVLASGPYIPPELLPEKIRARGEPTSSTRISLAKVDGTFAEARVAFERRYLREALESSGGNLSAAARMTGLDRSNLRRMLKRHGLVERD